MTLGSIWVEELKFIGHFEKVMESKNLFLDSVYLIILGLLKITRIDEY